MQMYYGDHLPPHFHARCAGHAVKIEIDTLATIEGSLPARALGLVIEWAALHQEELRTAFANATNMERPEKIEPQAYAVDAGHGLWFQGSFGTLIGDNLR